MMHPAALQALSTRPDNRPFTPTRQHGNETQGFFSRLLDLRIASRFQGAPGRALHMALQDAADTIVRMPAYYINYPGGARASDREATGRKSGGWNNRAE